jgi:uncharacterized protein (DUF427 family)
MAKAIWEGVVVAESDDCVMVEGNHYFPADSVRMEFMQPVDQTTVCGWKGVANYYDVVIGDKRNPGAAWYYAAPLPAASQVQGRVAFWKGVHIE